MDQKRFVRELSKTIVDDICKQIDDGLIPDTWDGIELRRLLAYRFKQAQLGSMSHSRVRSFNNTVAVNNL